MQRSHGNAAVGAYLRRSGADRPVQRAYALTSDPAWLTTPPIGGPRVTGTQAHQAIQQDFLSSHPPPGGHTELELPGGQSGPSRTGGDTSEIPPQVGASRPPVTGERRSPRFGEGKLDLVRRQPRNGFKIAEIKPASQYGEGLGQVAGYLGQMRQSDPEMVAWRRGHGVIPSQCGEMADRMYVPREYVRVGGVPVRVRWAVPGVVAYKELGGEEHTFLCGVDDQGMADRLVDDVLVRARDWGGAQLDPLQQRVIQNVSGLTTSGVDRILARYVDAETLAVVRRLIDERLLPELRRLVTQATNHVFSRIHEIFAQRVREYLRAQATALCVTAAALTAEQLWRALQRELQRLLEESVRQGLTEAAQLVGSLAATVVVAAAVAVLVAVGLFFLAVEGLPALAAVVSSLEVGAIVGPVLAALRQLALRYAGTLLPT